MKRLFFVLLLAGCSDKRIEITAKYVINENWSKREEEVGANLIEIRRMKLKKDSTINPFSEVSQVELFDKLDVDSSFIYSANVKTKPNESYEGKRVYFDRDNGFYWWSDRGETKTSVLGKLEAGSWYEISGLRYYYHVVYVDSAEKVHAFIVNLANY